jgi:hypothetical protein
MAFVLFQLSHELPFRARYSRVASVLGTQRGHSPTNDPDPMRHLEDQYTPDYP